MQTQVRDLYKTKRGLETEWAVQQRDNQRYTLDMVRIDNKIREVVNQIKQEEAKVANLVNKIEDAAPEVSVAT
jgi:DNA-directed RNA polymerase subunit F|tara:strand:- start:1029 stop:1247 length:219 start_codon:yes stop_codon:yes gene_type:complete